MDFSPLTPALSPRQDQERAAEKAAREQAQSEREALQRRREVLSWSQRTGKSLPAEGFAVGRPVNTLMQGCQQVALPGEAITPTSWL